MSSLLCANWSLYLAVVRLARRCSSGLSKYSYYCLYARRGDGWSCFFRLITHIQRFQTGKYEIAVPHGGSRYSVAIQSMILMVSLATLWLPSFKYGISSSEKLLDNTTAETTRIILPFLSTTNSQTCWAPELSRNRIHSQTKHPLNALWNE